MKRSRSGNKLAGDMLLTGAAVPTVVGLRLARMAEPPNMTNWIECNRMVMEKWVAGLEAAQAMGGELVQRQLQSVWQFWPAMGRLWHQSLQNLTPLEFKQQHRQSPSYPQRASPQE
ncbi:MAG: hypothetical protein R3E83_13265 [Burkholderiaceae bacterium]